MKRLTLGLLAMLASGCASVPAPLREDFAATPPGAVTIVLFTDFQCPFCRRTHAALEPIAERYGARVHLVIRHVPLPMHPNARDAARAAICSGQPSPIVHAADLSPEALLVRVGGADPAARERFLACVASTETERRIDRDVAAYEALGAGGVPLLYVGRTRLEGEPSSDTLELVVRQELAQTR